MVERIQQRVLTEKERLLIEARYCNEDRVLTPTNPVETMAQRNMWFETGTIPYRVWDISTTIIAVQSLESAGIISEREFIQFMDDFGFEVDDSGRRPKPAMAERIREIFNEYFDK